MGWHPWVHHEPLASVTRASVVEDRHRSFRLRYADRGGLLRCMHWHRPAVEIVLHAGAYRRMLLAVPDPEATVALIEAARGGHPEGSK